MSRLTIFLARYMGLFTILLVATLFVRGTATIDAVVANAPVTFTHGIASLAIGLAMILVHNVWRGGVLPVVVTLVGWVLFGKGLMLLAVAPETLSRYYQSMGYAANAHLYFAPALILGLYLTWAGFTAPMERAD